MAKNNYKIAIVAGEASGDLLGAELIAQLNIAKPGIQFIGVGGVAMQRCGLQNLVAMENFSIIGVVDLIKRLPFLLWERHKLLKKILAAKVDLFIGIDAPELNLALEKKLRKKGIKTVHYVSPTIWAWRPNRIFKIARAVDLMLVVFPFELEIYQQHKIPVKFVGHPLMRKLEYREPISREDARKNLGLPLDAPIIALMPGSRKSELKYLAKLLLATAQELQKSDPSYYFIAGMSDARNQQEFEQLIQQEFRQLPIKVYLNETVPVLSAADLVLCASGTVTLETMLINRPMIIVYKTHWLNAVLARLLIKIPYCGLPNIIAGQKIVPEYLQADANSENLTVEVTKILSDEEYRLKLSQQFAILKQKLALKTTDSLVSGIMELLK